MPIYEYCCSDCQQVFEEWQSGFEEQDIPCPMCGGSTKRLISNTSFVLKGSGWYADGYGSAPPKACETSSGGNGNGTNGKAKSEGAQAETKSETKSETKTESKPVAKSDSTSSSSTTTG
jgi:putative FmdB family regulatory protein